MQRRVETTQSSSPRVRRLDALNRENTRLEKAINRPLDAYQAERVTMDELRPQYLPYFNLGGDILRVD